MSDLQKKLYDYEVMPPGTSWDKIATALDESHVGSAFSQKLHAAEAVPPAGVWSSIAKSLDGEETPVIPVRRKNFGWAKLAAAAAIIGIIAFGASRWLGKSNTENTALPAEIAKKTVPPSTTDPVETKADPVEAEQPLLTDEENLAVVNTPAKTTKARSNRNDYIISDQLEATDAIYAYNEHTPNLSERYVLLMTPNGIVRMSKKLGNLVCCVSGEEQDEECKDQLKTWQEKLAATPATSTGNFMDILSLVSSLESDL